MKITTETQRHRESGDIGFSAFPPRPSASSAVKKLLNAEVAEECAEYAEKKILSLCLCGQSSFLSGDNAR
jgi:hypothetical protein